MNNVFISYAREDQVIAEKLAHALEGQNWKVFWDRRIPAGKKWREVIGENLASAQCVVVLWSKASITSDFVLDEAEIGRQQKTLIPVFIEQNLLPPLGFGGVQAADLSKWEGAPEDVVFRNLVRDIAASFPTAPAAPEKQEATSKRIQEILYRRQQFRRRYTLGGLTLGGALGAGLGLFLLRAIPGLTIMDFEGFALSVAFGFCINAAIVGGAFSFGIGLADQIWQAGNKPSPNKPIWIRILRRRTIVVIILGTLCFAVSHTTIALINSTSPLSVGTVYSILAALGAGLSLSIALHDQPYAGWRLSVGSWSWRIALVALTFAAIQIPFSFKRTAGIGLTLVGGFEFYRDNFYFWRLVPRVLKSPSYFATIDSALVGMVLCLGITVGMVIAAGLLARSLKLIDVDEKQKEASG